jgi:hypothetical protein
LLKIKPAMTVNLSTLFDVALTLVFIFFVLSLFVSGLVEFANGLVEKRAALFRAAMEKLLGPVQARAFFGQGIVAIKEERHRLFKRPVSYLSGDSFSTALIALLVAASGQVPQTTAETMQAIRAALARPDFAALRPILEPILHKVDFLPEFKRELETWYTGYMEQVSGWFKQYAQRLVWVAAVLVTVLLNVDTIRIANRLYADRTLRSTLVAQAEQAARQQVGQTVPDTAFLRYLSRTRPPLTRPDPATQRPALRADLTALDSLDVQGAYLEFARDRVEALGLPIGWTQPPNRWSAVGWLLTAAALSFGAPFWFDLLVKAVNIRNVARRPVPPKP